VTFLPPFGPADTDDHPLSLDEQICPIPSSLSSEAESTFQVQSQKYGFELEELTDHGAFYRDAETDGKGTDYFKVDLPNGKKLVHWIKKEERFGLQFGR